MLFPIRLPLIAFAAALFAVATPQTQPAIAQNGLCAQYHNSYIHKNKEMSYYVASTSRSATRRIIKGDDLDQLQINTELELKLMNIKISQMILLTLMENHGCTLPIEQSENFYYTQQARECINVKVIAFDGVEFLSKPNETLSEEDRLKIEELTNENWQEMARLCDLSKWTQE